MSLWSPLDTDILHGSEQSLFSRGKVVGPLTQDPGITEVREELERKASSADASPLFHGPIRELGGLDRNGGGGDQGGSM